jgi:hypothetical protein
LAHTRLHALAHTYTRTHVQYDAIHILLLTLTWCCSTAVRAYHQRYYRPNNALLCITGQGTSTLLWLWCVFVRRVVELSVGRTSNLLILSSFAQCSSQLSSHLYSVRFALNVTSCLLSSTDRQRRYEPDPSHSMLQIFSRQFTLVASSLLQASSLHSQFDVPRTTHPPPGVYTATPLSTLNSHLPSTSRC